MASTDIIGLSDRDHVRNRYGMYIGDVDNPAVAVREIIDNSIDEVLAKRASTIWVYSDKEKDESGNQLMRYTVADDGGGIPIKSTLNLAGEEITMAEFGVGSLRAGSKFNKTEIQAGTNGVGSACINYLSKSFTIYSKLSKHNIDDSTKLVKKLVSKLSKDTDYESMYYYVDFEVGYKVGEGLINIKDIPYIHGRSDLTVNPSTITSFIPDPDIWHSQNCTIPMNTRYLSYKCNQDNREVHFYINEKENTEVPESYEYSFNIRIQNEDEGTKNDFMEFYVSFGISEELDQVTEEYSVNTLSTQNGYHKRILKDSYLSAFESVFGSCRGYAALGINFLCIFSCPEPVFSSQTKERLSDIPGFSVYKEYTELVRAFVKIIKSNYEAFHSNYLRIQEYLRSKDQWTKLDEIKNSISVAADLNGKRVTANNPRKLKDCLCSDRTKAELYICEGKSASGALCSARAGMNNIAVLGLRGRPMNTSGMDIIDILENEEMHDLIVAIGVGVNDYHSLDQLRYGKVIIATDSDPDGYAIANLILGVITQQMTFLLENGMVYIAIAPLYEQDNKYYWIGEEDQIDFNKPLIRYKGLGEVNPDKLKDFLLNPETRRLVRITTANMQYANALLSSTHARKELMISKGIITEGDFDITKETA
jgi:DNA gyrase/topoisomerase IV subunit B